MRILDFKPQGSTPYELIRRKFRNGRPICGQGVTDVIKSPYSQFLNDASRYKTMNGMVRLELYQVRLKLDGLLENLGKVDCL